MKPLTLLLSLCLTVSVSAQLTKVGPRNAYVYNPGKAAPLHLNFPGMGQVGFDANRLLSDGFGYLFTKEGFKPPKDVFIVVMQDQYGAFSPSYIKGVLNTLKGMYPLMDTANITVSGFSIGGQAAYSSAIGITPKAIFAHSPAAIDANATARIIANKIPVYLYAGENDGPYFRPNAEAAFKEINAKVPGLAKLEIFPSTGHSGWNNTYKSAAFWNAINAPSTPLPLTAFAGKDTTVQQPAAAQLRGEATGEGLQFAWKSLTAGSSAFSNPSIPAPTFSTMVAGTYTLQLTVTDKYGKTATDQVVVTFQPKPPPPAPKELFKVYISGVDFFGLDNGTVRRSKGTWSGSSGVLVAFPCGTQTITITNNAKWVIK